ncbi:hypothetical protein [Vibrio mangrovi]|uniref:Uncharacterized protein n=1 Tax=Vibrio mangrovi TaxID=474394 RepID=A0ABU4IAV1_9VIBR|nr:hypothetical protein [Vibrio mangrovi]MDW6005100.1 hypothetical protein [Vibrio mangrovi]
MSYFVLYLTIVIIIGVIIIGKSLLTAVWSGKDPDALKIQFQRESSGQS